MKKFTSQILSLGLGTLFALSSYSSFSQTTVCTATLPPNPNELVVNGGFEQNINRFTSEIPDYTIGTPTTCNNFNVKNWGAYSWFSNARQWSVTPNYWVRNPTNGSAPLPMNGITIDFPKGSKKVETHDFATNPDNDSYVHVLSSSSTSFGVTTIASEGISTQLRTPAIPSQFYKASAYVFADNIDDDVPVFFYFHNNYDKTSALMRMSTPVSATFRNSNDPNFNYYKWEKVEVVFQLPANAPVNTFTHLGVEIVGKSGGSFFIDDVSLVETCPTPVNAGPDQTICQNSAGVTLTATGASTYTWYIGTDIVGTGPTYYAWSNSSGPETYTVVGTSSTGCVSTDDVTVFANPQPALSLVSTSPQQTTVGQNKIIYVCQGDPVTITMSGALTYAWRYNSVSLSGVPGQPNKCVYNPTVSGSFYVTGYSADGCPSSEERIMVVVRPAPTNITASIRSGYPSTICAGQSTQLQFAGGTSTYPVTYTWSPATGLSSTTASIVTASPTQTTTYKVTASVTTSGATCSKESFVTVYVNQPTNFDVVLSWPNLPVPIPPAIDYCNTGLRFEVTNSTTSTITGNVVGTQRSAPFSTWISTILVDPTFPTPIGQTPAHYYVDPPCYSGGLDLEITITVDNNQNCGSLTKKYYTYAPNIPKPEYRTAPETPKTFSTTYPNPASEYLIIESQRISNYSLYDGFGKEVLSGKLNKEKNRVETKKLKKGLYFLHIQNGEEIEKQQIVIE